MKETGYSCVWRLWRALRRNVWIPVVVMLFIALRSERAGVDALIQNDDDDDDDGRKHVATTTRSNALAGMATGDEEADAAALMAMGTSAARQECVRRYPGRRVCYEVAPSPPPPPCPMPCRSEFFEAVDRSLYVFEYSSLNVDSIMIRVNRGSDGAHVHGHQYVDPTYNAVKIGGGKLLVAASTSKIVTSLVILAIITDGLMTMDTTTAQVLGWRGTRGRITVRMLGHMVSGLNVLDPEARMCAFPDYGTRDEMMSLKQCAELIGAQPLRAEPGTKLDFGPNHWFVLAYMAERATGKKWNALVNKYLLRPLGINTKRARYGQWVLNVPWNSRFELKNYYIGGNTLSGFKFNTNAPNPAAGFVATADQLAIIMTVISSGGLAPNGRRLIRSNLIEQMNTNRYVGAQVLPLNIYGMAGQFGYRCGFGTVLYCDKSLAAWRRSPKCAYYGSISASGVIAYGYTGTSAYTAVLATGITDGYQIALALEVLRREIDTPIARVMRDYFY